MKYIIDTDPGIDDAIAIMLAYLNKLDIIGFTLAQGNVPIKKTEHNLKIIEEVLNTNIKIYKSKDVKRATQKADHAHGKNGLGDIRRPKTEKEVEKQTAEDFIINSSHKYPKLTIICIGPATNLANALKQDPTLVDRVSKVVMMSLSYNPKGKPYREFNLMIDPVSAKEVLEAKFKEINIVTHEAGIKATIEKEYIDKLAQSDSNISIFVNKISQKYIEFSKKRYKVDGITAPDLITVTSLIDKNIITFKPCKVEINLEDKGLSEVTLVKKSNIKISTRINVTLFRKLFKKTFR